MNFVWVVKFFWRWCSATTCEPRGRFSDALEQHGRLLLIPSTTALLHFDDWQPRKNGTSFLWFMWVGPADLHSVSLFCLVSLIRHCLPWLLRWGTVNRRSKNYMSLAPWLGWDQKPIEQPLVVKGCPFQGSWCSVVWAGRADLPISFSPIIPVRLLRHYAPSVRSLIIRQPWDAEGLCPK